MTTDAFLLRVLWGILIGLFWLMGKAYHGVMDAHCEVSRQLYNCLIANGWHMTPIGEWREARFYRSKLAKQWETYQAHPSWFSKSYTAFLKEEMKR